LEEGNRGDEDYSDNLKYTLAFEDFKSPINIQLMTGCQIAVESTVRLCGGLCAGLVTDSWY
jgi:hypothetical protein